MVLYMEIKWYLLPEQNIRYRGIWIPEDCRRTAPERRKWRNCIKEGKPVADTSLRDTENVPLTEDIKEYFKREVLPYAPEAWIDEKKTKKRV